MRKAENKVGHAKSKTHVWKYVLLVVFCLMGFYSSRAEADGSMISISTPTSVHIVVTDPQGRKSEFDPKTKTTYSGIPNATYGEQSIDTPADEGFTPCTLTSERQFMISAAALPGLYQVQVFSLVGGKYYLDYRGCDLSGDTNDAHYLTGTLKAGSSTIRTVNHLTTPAPIPNARLDLSQYTIQTTGSEEFKKATIQGPPKSNSGTWTSRKSILT